MASAKRLGIAMVTIVSVLAAVGVGQASATRLCKVEGTLKTCPEASVYPAGTPLKLVQSVGEATFIFGFTNKCESSTLKGVTTGAGGKGTGEEASVPALFKEAVWGNCTCGTFAIHPPFEVDFFGAGNRNGSMDYIVEIEFNCGGTVCKYRGHLLSAVTGGGLATVEIKTEALKKVEGGAFCSSTAVWKSAYEFVQPMPMYVTEN